MINTGTQSEISLVSILTRMHESPYEFYLTGSRYFKPASSVGRDFDFFVGPSLIHSMRACVEFLEELGFQKLSHSYDDVSVNVVYRYPGNGMEYVDVQILHSRGYVRNKVIAQTLLKNFGFLEPSRDLWNMILTALDVKPE